VELKVYHRTQEGDAEKTAQQVLNVFRVETTSEADDGQQYMIMLLDADDSFDIVVQYPDNQREIVWSLVRERYGAE